ncbi:hypothetical protein D3C73_551890 [compost metagenome]
MKWFELQEKAKVKLLVDLRVINVVAVTNYAYVTPSELDRVAPIAHKAGAVYTIYHDRQPGDVELFCEATDDVLMWEANDEIPPHFEVL